MDRHASLCSREQASYDVIAIVERLDGKEVEWMKNVTEEQCQKN